ncbi:MAG TPA: hypothetical protein VLT45_24860, partial [Kofleriaceae bacterium]|nr:hypothetical protein [Kofleriaceae bacterium]
MSTICSGTSTPRGPRELGFAAAGKPHHARGRRERLEVDEVGERRLHHHRHGGTGVDVIAVAARLDLDPPTVARKVGEPRHRVHPAGTQLRFSPPGVLSATDPARAPSSGCQRLSRSTRPFVDRREAA